MSRKGTKDDRVDIHEELALAALAELAEVRPTSDAVGAAVAAAALLAQRAAEEVAQRDRVIRIARSEGATLRALAAATGLSHQTISNICAGARPRTAASIQRTPTKRARAT